MQRCRTGCRSPRTFHAGARQVITVANGALLMNNDSTTVFVETAPWIFTRRAVTPGFDDGASSVITSGLAPGDRVITAGGVLLND